MANLTKDTSNNLWPVPISVSDSGTTTHILQTENKFVDANISIKVTTPAASGAALSIYDKGSTDITIGTVSNEYYPLSTSLTGKLTVSTAGWLTTSGLSASTEGEVTVGRIAQSVLKNGTTSISSGDTITPNVSSTQTINITAGYNEARTVIVGAMSSGTAAAATVSATKQATAPTLVHTASQVTNKTQIAVSPRTGTSDISKYYIAVTANAPATSFNDITKTINTAGYLGDADQITASASTSANDTLYYVPISTGGVTISGSTQATAPTAENNRSASVNGKTKIAAAPTTDTNTIDTYYMAIKVNAPATTISLSKSVTSGYISADSEVTASAGTSAKSSTYYIPITSTSLVKGSGVASASSGNVALTSNGTTQPESGYYITVQGSGTVQTSGTAGWIAANTSQTSNTATAYYTIPTATFTVSGNQVKSNTAGYIGANTAVGTISNGSLANTATSNVTYTEVTTPVLSPQGYLYINAGYFSNKKISLATLIPDDSNYRNAAVGHILSGYEAYDTDGKKLIGTITTYNGEYTVG